MSLDKHKPLTLHRASAIGHIQADRQTDRQTDRHTQLTGHTKQAATSVVESEAGREHCT